PVDALGDAHFGLGSKPFGMKNAMCTGSESTLKKCGFIQSTDPDACLDKRAQVICSEVRLVGGSRCSGRLEILDNQTWVSVCAAAFDQQDAEVVCRELDCGAPVQVLGEDAFGKGDAQMWTQEIQCRGNESQIHLCPTSPSHEITCSYENDVGLVCADNMRVRLVGGKSRCAGRVEVLHRGQWGTVCGVDFDMSDAAVVCRELDCGEPVDALHDVHFGPGSGPIWTNRKLCTGSESTLKNCGSVHWGVYKCDHTKDAGVICSGVRLIGNSSCSGRLEILDNQTWVSMCAAAFDQQDAEVVCRELDCGAPVQVLGEDAFGKGDAQMWTQEIQCRGDESQIHFCPTSLDKNSCSHDKYQGLFCAEFKEIRLTEGCEGNVEVFYNGSWGNVCWNQMDRDTVSLICQELNCGRSGVLSDSITRVKSAPNWLDKVKCRPHDSNLWQCPSSPWGQNDCDEDEVAKITCSKQESHESPRSSLSCSTSPHQRQCSDHVPLRLSGGEGRCSGRLEVYHNAVWGSVCDDLWDISDAQVVCRQLGCGAALRADGNSVFGAGEGVVWLNRVECRGNEIHLWDCPLSLKKHTDCSNKDHAGLTCADLSVSTTPATTTSSSPPVSQT
ncbi:hypothetical protein ABG768_021029, partial [Culter alburnus]